MAEITIRWNQRVAGRFPGTVETVENTDFIRACIGQGRCDSVGYEPEAPVAEPADLVEVVDLDLLDAVEAIEPVEVAAAIEAVAVVKKRRAAPRPPEPTFESLVEADIAGMALETPEAE